MSKYITGNQREILSAQSTITGQAEYLNSTSGKLNTIVSSQTTQGVIDGGNSTSTPLGSNKTFTGTGIDVLGYTSAEITVHSDKISAINGLKLQTSADGANWYHAHNYSITTPDVNNLGECFQFTLTERYFRVVYVNGATAQTSFVLSTRLNYAASGPHYHDIDFVIDGSHPAAINRSILVGEDITDNSYDNVNTVSATNTAGTYRALQTLDSGRPSLVPGRTAKFVTVNGITADTNVSSVTAGKTFYVTDLTITINNSANTPGHLNVRDSTTAGGGTLIMPIEINEGPGAGTALTTITRSFTEPLQFATAVYYDITAGTLTISAVMSGYEE